MIKRSISLPVKPQNENQQKLERSEEIEELCEIDEDDEIQLKNNLLKNNNTNLYSDNDCDDEDSGDDDDDHHLDCNTCENKNLKQSKDKQYKKENNISMKELKKRRNQNFEFLTENQNQKELLIENLNRVINQSGRANVNLCKLPKKSLKFCKDFVTTLVEQKWRYTLTIFVGSYVLIWFVFALLWYLIAYSHGDLLFDKNGKRLGEGIEPCIIGAKSFLEIFIYTAETQITIGFGEKYPSEHCPESVFLFVVQFIVCLGLEGAMIGIIYSKMSRPIKYSAEFKFSKKAVISYRDGKLCLIFRVCDPGQHQTIDTKIRAYIIFDKLTSEGEILRKVRKELKIVGGSSPIIIWPETICHIINNKSPLYEFINEKDQQFIKNFEIFVSLVGDSLSMGHATESKTSYLPNEIFWNYQFSNIIEYDWQKDSYFVDYNNFNRIIPLKN